jgi:hypothetical protein
MEVQGCQGFGEVSEELSNLNLKNGSTSKCIIHKDAPEKSNISYEQYTRHFIQIFHNINIYTESTINFRKILISKSYRTLFFYHLVEHSTTITTTIFFQEILTV